MALSDVVNLTITEVSSAITRPGFGTIGIFDYNTRYSSNLVRKYTSLAGMTSDGFLPSDAAYAAAAAVFAQNPHPPAVKVLRRTVGPTWTAKLTPAAVNNTVYSVSIALPGAVSAVAGNTASYTSDGTATVAEIVTGLTSAITALSISGLTATDNSTYVGLAGGAGKLFGAFGNNPALIAYIDITADSGTTCATQLASCNAEDNDWYGLIATSTGDAELTAIGSWAGGNGKLFMATSHDTGNITTTGGSDVFATLKSTGSVHTVPYYVENRLEFGDAGLMSSKFAINPGGEDWAFQSVQGQTPSSSVQLSDTFAANLAAKNANYDQTLGGKNLTFWGTCASGDFVDTIRFIDWLQANLQLDILALLASLSNSGSKLPYTDAGAVVLKNAILARLQQGIQAGGLASSPSPTVTVPSVASQNPTDRSNRYFPNVTFSAQLAGSIHKTQIAGSVSV